MSMSRWLDRACVETRGVAQGFRSEPMSENGPRKGCLAYRYARCRDFSHCQHCSMIEQALRTAATLQDG
jgi:hypothetical protein